MIDLAISGTVLMAVCVYGIASHLRFRRYLNGLPPSAGNRQIQRRHTIMLAWSVGMLVVGLGVIVYRLGL